MHRSRYRYRSPQRRSGYESLEARRLLAGLPFGAAADDTGEYMLGDVLVTAVLLESDGSLDENLEDWTVSQREEIRQRVTEGTQWWSELLDQQNSVHELNFHYDFTYLDSPIQTGYEPINRPSDEFMLWIEDFFEAVDVSSRGTFSDRILEFNHQQRLVHGTDWAFTVFVVNADNDSDSRFDPAGSFSRAFAYAGGRFFVTTSERPPSTIAHETAHMFWALDEYANGASYNDHRGYYNTQNLNGLKDNPQPELRVKSLLESHLTAYTEFAVSPSALEMIGWKDSDENGVFDVLDVPHQLTVNGVFDADSDRYSVIGSSQVTPLENQNPIGNGNDITLNEISRLEVRFDDSAWETVAEFHLPTVSLDFTLDVPASAEQIQLRTIDDDTQVSSAVFTDFLERPLIDWHNHSRANDVNNDLFVSPIDALLVINELNQNGSRSLLPASPDEVAGQFLDVSGDNFLSPVDALLVINELNQNGLNQQEETVKVSDHDGQPTAEGEPPLLSEFAIWSGGRFDSLSHYSAAIRDEPDRERLRTARSDDLEHLSNGRVDDFFAANAWQSNNDGLKEWSSNCDQRKFGETEWSEDDFDIGPALAGHQ